VCVIINLISAQYLLIITVFPFSYIYLDRKNFAWARILVITPCAKTSQSVNGRKLSSENFDEENVHDELIKIRQYFHCQNFVPYSSRHFYVYVIIR